MAKSVIHVSMWVIRICSRDTNGVIEVALKPGARVPFKSISNFYAHHRQTSDRESKMVLQHPGSPYSHATQDTTHLDQLVVESIGLLRSPLRAH